MKGSALECWVFQFTILFGFCPDVTPGSTAKKSLIAAWILLIVNFGVFCWWRSVSMLSVINSGDTISMMQNVLGFSMELFIHFGSIWHACTVAAFKNKFLVIGRVLGKTKSSNFRQNFGFLVILASQIVNACASYGHFLALSKMFSVGAMNQLVASTLNYLILLQFCAVLSGIRNIMTKTNCIMKNRVVKLRSHAALLGLCKVTVSLYEKQIFLIVIQIFGYIVTYAFNYYLSIALSYAHSGYSTYLTLNVVLRLTMMLMIAAACENLQREAEEFNNQLFRMMHESHELCSNKKLRLFIRMKPTVNFTACGFFRLGYPLVTSIIAAATTYLVILVQFSMN